MKLSPKQKQNSKKKGKEEVVNENAPYAKCPTCEIYLMMKDVIERNKKIICQQEKMIALLMNHNPGGNKINPN